MIHPAIKDYKENREILLLDNNIKTKSIGIKFGDNDFTNTNSFFLKKLAEFSNYRKSFFDLSNEEIATLYNLLATGLYFLVQNEFTYSHFKEESPYKEHIKHMQNYLKVDSSKVLLDDEVDAKLDYLLESGNWNSDFNYALYYEDHSGEVILVSTYVL